MKFWNSPIHPHTHTHILYCTVPIQYITTVFNNIAEWVILLVEKILPFSYKLCLACLSNSDCRNWKWYDMEDYRKVLTTNWSFLPGLLLGIEMYTDSLKFDLNYLYTYILVTVAQQCWSPIKLNRGQLIQKALQWKCVSFE